MSIGDFPESLSQAMLVGIMLVGAWAYEEYTRLAETRLAQNTLTLY